MALTVLADRPALRPTPPGTKPMFPVATTLAVPGARSPGGAVRVLASVTAWAPGETVEWSLRLPPGVTLVSGVTRWSGTLESGETRPFELFLAVPAGAAGELYGAARLPERARATAGASARIAAGGAPAADAALQFGVGETRLQYQGEVRPR